MLRPALISAQRPDLFEVKQGTPPGAFCRRIAVWQSAGRILDLPARPSPIDRGWATSEGGVTRRSSWRLPRCKRARRASSSPRGPGSGARDPAGRRGTSPHPRGSREPARSAGPPTCRVRRDPKAAPSREGLLPKGRRHDEKGSSSAGPGDWPDAGAGGPNRRA